MLGNIGPSSQVEDGLADKYPLSAYALDYHVDVGVTAHARPSFFSTRSAPVISSPW